MTSIEKRSVSWSTAVLALAAASCSGGSGPGTAKIFVEGEDTITDGLKPGSDLESIKDGWTVSYDKFVITLGNVRASQSKDPAMKLSDPKLQVIDMRSLPAAGLILAEFTNVDDTRWDKVGYDQGYATSSSVKAAGTSDADFAKMTAGGFSLYVGGSITKAGRTVKFDWGLKSGVAWDDCGPASGDKGFAVPGGGTVQVKATIHGDHWFFNNFPEGEEKTDRLAQWIADVDDKTGKDGTVTVDDLQAVPAAMVFPAGTYSLQNPLGEAINTALDYVVTQARTIGHLQGEGECDTRKKI